MIGTLLEYLSCTIVSNNNQVRNIEKENLEINWTFSQFFPKLKQ